MPGLHGRFVWYDLMTTDTAAAERFYNGVIGWGTQAWGGPSPYTMRTSNGTPLGGMVSLADPNAPSGVPPHWLAYVSVDDMEAAVARTKQLGGSVLFEPQDIPDAGRFAVIQDPQGASIALYSALRDTPPAEPSPGQFTWHELMSSDSKAAFDFYSALFGWEKTSDFDMGPEVGIYQMYGQGGQPYGGMYTSPDPALPPTWCCYIAVVDVDAAVSRVRELGGQVIQGPMEVPGGDMIAQCLDPQGAMFAVHQRKAV